MESSKWMLKGYYGNTNIIVGECQKPEKEQKMSIKEAKHLFEGSQKVNFKHDILETLFYCSYSNEQFNILGNVLIRFLAES